MFESRLFKVVLLLLFSAAAYCADDGNLLPVEQAFKLDSKVIDREHIQLTWQIADRYYLYRDRIKVKSATEDITLGELSLPPGKRKHDEFLGDVEIYHSEATATQTLQINNPSLVYAELKVTVQGCHEEEPKICYPPYTSKITLELPAIATAPTSLISKEPMASSGIQSLTQALSKNNNLLSTDQSAPLPPEQAFIFEAIVTRPTEILARWTMPKSYYLYRDKTEFISGKSLKNTTENIIADPQFHWPDGVKHRDENFGETMVYFNQVELPISFQRMSNEAQTMALTMAFQGCQDNGICYPLMTRTVSVELPVLKIANQTENTASIPLTAIDKQPTVNNSAELAEDQRWAERLGDNRLLALLSFFGIGLLLSFTPCVFPMIPILSGIIAGSGAAISTKRAFFLSLIYVLSSSVIFTLAGVIAGLAGKNLQAAFQAPWLLWSFSGLFVLLSLSMFGFYELQMPLSWQSKIANLSNNQRSGSVTGTAIMGVLSALIVGPCVAPPLAGAVLYIGQKQDPVLGGLALFILSLGMGTPLLAFGTTAGNLLPRVGAWMETVKTVFGITFLALAIWMLSRILDPLWIMLMTGTLMIACGVYLGALEPLPSHATGWKKLWKTFGVLLLLGGATELIGVAAGGRDVTQPLKRIIASHGEKASQKEELPFKMIKSLQDLDKELAAAKAAGKFIMLDFYADWCVACKEMEKFTFSKTEIHNALKDFVLLKADVTPNDAIDQAFLKHFELFGPPATLFFDKNSNEQRNLRLTGFENADKFIARVEAFKK